MPRPHPMERLRRLWWIQNTVPSVIKSLVFDDIDMNVACVSISFVPNIVKSIDKFFLRPVKIQIQIQWPRCIPVVRIQWVPVPIEGKRSPKSARERRRSYVFVVNVNLNFKIRNKIRKNSSRNRVCNVLKPSLLLNSIPNPSVRPDLFPKSLVIRKAI